MAGRLPVRDVYEHNEVTIHHEATCTQQVLRVLNRDTFRDQKWENALAHLRANGMADAEHVAEILLEGARAFGMWRVSNPALRSLVSQVLEDARGGPSSGLQSWIALRQEAASVPQERWDLTDLSLAFTRASDSGRSKRALAPAGRCARLAWALKADVGDAMTLVKWSLSILLVAASAAYASWVVWCKYVGILDLFAWPILFARAAGLAAAVITGLMYLTMARTFMKQAYLLLSVNSKVLIVLDGHKDIHIFLAKGLAAAAFVHVLAHLLSTVPALRFGSAEQLNSILACADRDHKLRAWPTMDWLQWPACPLTAEFMSWGEIFFQSTPGLSGVVLIALLLLLGWTGRAQSRSQKFDRFWYAHNLILVAWPLAMFVHGSNQWIGVGFPLVAFTSTIPMCLYLVDRVMRLLRYYLYSSRAVRIASAVIRPGKDGGPAGALTHLEIEKPPGLWTFVPGMYAFINMPEYAPLQWHPFTICSGKDDEHVEFIISAVGDWTNELAARCLSAQRDQCALPQVALDGPYAAPAQSALARPILVAVGAGVGITPFLSLMSSLISLIESSSESEAKAVPLKEAHFFWMTRSADEFLFGRKHFSRIASSPQLRQKVHLHLHTTAREPEGDAAAYLFRQAVKRQSALDRAVFAEECDGRQVLTAPQLPWCWVNSSQLDVMWLSDLTTASCRMAAAEWESYVSQEGETPPGVWAMQAGKAQAAEEGRAAASSMLAFGASARSFSDAPASSHDARAATTLRRSPSQVTSIREGASSHGSPGLLAPPGVPSSRDVSRREVFGSEAASGLSGGHADWAQQLLPVGRRLSTRSLASLSARTDLGPASFSPQRAIVAGSGSPLAQADCSGSPPCNRSRPTTRAWLSTQAALGPGSFSPQRATAAAGGSPLAQTGLGGSPARTRSRSSARRAVSPRSPRSACGTGPERTPSSPSARNRDRHPALEDEVLENDEPGVIFGAQGRGGEILAGRVAPPAGAEAAGDDEDVVCHSARSWLAAGEREKALETAASLEAREGGRAAGSGSAQEAEPPDTYENACFQPAYETPDTVLDGDAGPDVALGGDGGVPAVEAREPMTGDGREGRLAGSAAQPAVAEAADDQLRQDPVVQGAARRHPVATYRREALQVAASLFEERQGGGWRCSRPGALWEEGDACWRAMRETPDAALGGDSGVAGEQPGAFSTRDGREAHSASSAAWHPIATYRREAFLVAASQLEADAPDAPVDDFFQAMRETLVIPPGDDGGRSAGEEPGVLLTPRSCGGRLSGGAVSLTRAANADHSEDHVREAAYRCLAANELKESLVTAGGSEAGGLRCSGSSSTAREADPPKAQVHANFRPVRQALIAALGDADSICPGEESGVLATGPGHEGGLAGGATPPAGVEMADRGERPVDNAACRNLEAAERQAAHQLGQVADSLFETGRPGEEAEPPSDQEDAAFFEARHEYLAAVPGGDGESAKGGPRALLPPRGCRGQLASWAAQLAAADEAADDPLRGAGRRRLAATECQEALDEADGLESRGGGHGSGLREALETDPPSAQEEVALKPTCETAADSLEAGGGGGGHCSGSGKARQVDPPSVQNDVCLQPTRETLVTALSGSDGAQEDVCVRPTRDTFSALSTGSDGGLQPTRDTFFSVLSGGGDVGSAAEGVVRAMTNSRSITSDEDSFEDDEVMLPVAFGRPDFEAELRAIGKHWHGQEKVHVYVCGNDAIVQGLRDTADALNADARLNAREASARTHKYIVTYERFG